MKNLIYGWCLMLCLPIIVKSQNLADKLQAELSPSGVYLNIGIFPAKGQVGIVERDKGEGFETIGTLSAPTTPAMLYQRMQNYSLRLPDYFMVTNQLSNTLWQHMLTNKETILKEAVPVALLALGAAFIDTTANLPINTKYRIQLGERKWESLAIAVSADSNVPSYLVFYKLQAAAQVIRAEWRLNVSQQPKIITVNRKRLGIDSSFTTIKSNLGYEKTKKGDSLSVHLSDTTVLPGISYAYYLSGKDYLGRITSRSDTIRTIAGNRTTVNAINRFITKTARDSSGIQLNWSLQTKYTIRSIRILRSAYYDSTFVQVAVLSAVDTAWIDRSVAVGANYYYQLIAQGDDDYAYPSPRVFGSFLNKQRLIPPTSLHIQKIESNVNLTWKYHTYMNLLGFRVYRALGNQGKFAPISDVIAPTRDSLIFSYIDKDKSLVNGEFYTYAVAAIGRNHMESPLSGIAQINLAEKLKPNAPYQVRSMMLTDSTVSLTWKVDQTVNGFYVFRKAIGVDSVKGFIKLNNQPLNGTNKFIDMPGLAGAWQYVVQAINQTDSSSFSLPTVVKFLEDKPLPPGNVQLFAQKNSVIINWDGSTIPNVTKYNIYRATGSTAPIKIATVAIDAPKSYEDKKLSNGNLYFYYLTLETNKQVESDKSKEISIRLKQ